MITDKLKEYKTIKTEILKNWSESKFDLYKKNIYYTVKHNFYNNIKYTAGSRPALYNNLSTFAGAAEIEDLFGFPYTSSSDLAALWNTNTEAKANIRSVDLYFRGAAIDADGDAVLIFNNQNDDYFYFKDFDFLQFMDFAKETERAQDIERFHAGANKIKNLFYETIADFEGKQHGAQTAKKIDEIIKEKSKDLNINFYYDKNNHSLEIYTDCDSGKLRSNFYIKITDDNNTIKTPETKNDDLKIINYKKAIKDRESLKKKINAIAPELLNLIEKYNDLQIYLHNDVKDSQTFNFQLYTIAKYGLKD